MKKIVMAIVILLATLTNSFAGNSVYIQQDNQTSAGSVYIKQDGSGNKFGSSSANFIINGPNLTLIIKQLGDNNVAVDTNHDTFYGSNMTFDYIATGDSNVLRLDLDDTGADGHYYDIDITGNSNIVELDSHTSDDIQDTHIDLDIKGDSNDFWAYLRGDSHFLYVLMSGDSNDVEFYGATNSTGMVGSSKANVMIGPNVESHGQFADTSGDEGATIDVYIIGSSNTVHMASWGASNYQVHDVIGDSNVLDVHPDAVGSHIRMIQYGDNNYMKTVTSGNSNVYRYYGSGGNNKAYVYIYTSNAVVELKQTGGSNEANLTVSGDSIYDYTLLVDQDGSDNCTYSFNRNNQTADTTVQLNNSGC
jgi:hypothetical protein|tara:strand:+ start:6052 stop:7137 length:1086 start_codon:yes stop_codon:yes gene_type:complete